LTPAIVNSNAHLFAPRHAYRANFYGGASTGATGGGPRAANPSSGAVVYYWLKAPRQVVTLDFLDSKGNVIRHFTSEQDSAAAADSIAAGAKKLARRDSLAKAGISQDSINKLERSSEETAPPRAGGRRGGPQSTRVANKQGLNMFDWNLRYPDAATFKGLVFWGGGVTGPVAPPGTYSVRMTTGGVTQTQKFELLKDPRTNATQHDLDEQFAFLMKIRDTLSAANNAVRTVRNVRWQVEQRNNALPAGDRAAFTQQTEPVLQKLSTIEQAIYQVQSHASEDPLNFPIRINNKIAALGGVVGGAASRPTDQSYEVYKVLSAQLATQLNALHTTLAELKGANTFLASHGGAAIVPSTAEVGKAAADEDEGEGDMEGESGER